MMRQSGSTGVYEIMLLVTLSRLVSPGRGVKIDRIMQAINVGFQTNVVYMKLFCLDQSRYQIEYARLTHTISRKKGCDLK